MDLLRKITYLLSRRRRWQAGGLLAMVVLGAALEAMSVGIIFPLIALLINPEQVPRLPLVGQASALLGSTTNQQLLIWSSVVILAAFIGKNLYLAIMYRLIFRWVYEGQRLLIIRLLTAYVSSNYPFHVQRNTAELLRNVNHEAMGVYHNVVLPLLVIVVEVLVALLVTAVLLSVNAVTALIALTCVGIPTLIFFRLVHRQLDRTGKAQQLHQGGMIRWVNQSLGGIKETKVLGRESFFLNGFAAEAGPFNRAMRYQQTVQQYPRLFLETAMVSFMLLIILLALFQGRSVQSVVPVLALFATAAFRLIPSVNRIITMASQVRFFRPSVEVVYRDLKELEAQALGPPRPTRQGVDVQPIRSMPFQHTIELQNLDFRYPQTAEHALRGVSLTIPRGRFVAFIGPSGAGKTTLVDIILGLLEPTRGTVVVDDRDIQDDLPAWQRNVGYVPQTIYLYDTSVRANVAFGVPDREIDDGQVWRALRMAELEGLVRRLPQGLDTLIGENGVRFSGGERQRLGIARALYHNPSVLVLDEATSSLDYDTEREVAQSIEALRGQATVIRIAHRLTSITNCDDVYLLERGQVVGLMDGSEMRQYVGSRPGAVSPTTGSSTKTRSVSGSDGGRSLEEAGTRPAYDQQEQHGH